MLHRLDADAYNEADVVVLTLPVSLPYSIHNPVYERTVGEVEYRGEFYHLVKQKVENDTIFMVCVKDAEQKRIQQRLNEYTNLSSDIPSDAKKTIDHLGKLFKDYTASKSYRPSKFLQLKYDFVYAENSLRITQPSIPIDSPPPRLA
jgi:hypothetical protein